MVENKQRKKEVERALKTFQAELDRITGWTAAITAGESGWLPGDVRQLGNAAGRLAQSCSRIMGETGRQTTVIPTMVRDGKESTFYGFEVVHDAGVDPRAAIKAAAQEYLGTREGERYLKSICGDGFNWGDAAHVPPGILRKHGIHSYRLALSGEDCLDHDETIAHGKEDE